MMINDFAHVVGWTLVHSLWQGAVVALIVGLALTTLRRSAASTRYVVCCGGLLVVAILPIVTALVLAADRLGAPEVAVLGGLIDETSVRSRLTNQLPALSLTWLIGVVLFQLRFMIQIIRAQRLRTRETSAVPASLIGVTNRLRDRLGVRVSVQIRQTPRVTVPMLVGWLRPVVLLPPAVLAGLTPAQLEAVIAHELAHVRRHDFIVNLVQIVIESFMFYHPAVWWLTHRVRIEREFCCDDMVVAACGNNICYARALANLDDLRDVGSTPALASTGGSLMQRIDRIVGSPSSSGRTRGGLIPMALSLCFLGAVTATAFAMPADGIHAAEHDGHQRQAPKADPLERVDIAAIVSSIDPERGAILEELQSVGVNNRLLVEVLKSMVTDEKFMHVVELKVHEELRVAEHLEQMRRKVAEELDPNMSPEEIEQAMLDAETELRVRVEQQLVLEHMERAAKDRLAAMTDELTRRVELGEMTEEEARDHLAQAKADIRDHLAVALERRAAAGEFDRRDAHVAQRRRVDALRVAAEHDLHALQMRADQLMAAVEAGEISREEAQDTITKLQVAIEERALHLHQLRVRVEEQAVLQREVEQLKRDLTEAVHAGEITKEQAHRELAAVLADLERRQRAMKDAAQEAADREEARRRHDDR